MRPLNGLLFLEGIFCLDEIQPSTSQRFEVRQENSNTPLNILLYKNKRIMRIIFILVSQNSQLLNLEEKMLDEDKHLYK